jgi:CheY-like chemotaxis protein
LGLVNQLLDFRKLDVNAHNLQESHGDIVLFMREQTLLFSEAMRKKQMILHLRLKSRYLFMWFDADKIGKVMVNLLSNAYKFTPEGGHVAVCLRTTIDNKLSVSVTDDGIGIPEKDLSRIFERFYQVSFKDKVNYQGSGIGLHIAKEFVELHGGKIFASNSPGGGSCFEFVLPIHNEKRERGSEVIVSDGQKKISEEVTEASIVENRPKLLIIEDNEDLCSFLVSQFKNEYSVLQAGNGTDGIDIAFNEIPDLILSDVMMPGWMVSIYAGL